MPSRRLKQLAEVVFSSVDKKAWEDEVPVRLCNYTDVYYNDEITPDLPFIEASATVDEVRKFTLKTGDTLITKDSETADDIGVPSFVPNGINDVLCGYHLALVRPRPGVSPKYLYWALASPQSRRQLESAASGVTRFGLRHGDVGNLQISFPEAREQLAVADFLDRETARIDGLLRAKQNLSARVGERLRNEIVEAVTKGLSKARLRPVSSSWFPHLPASWTVESLKRRWTVIDCKHRTPAYVPQGYPLVSHGEIEDGHVYPGRSGRFVGEDDFFDLIEGRRPKPGDVIYTRNAAIGNAGFVETAEEFAMGQDVCLITSQEQDQRFLTYFLNYVALDQLEANKLGATFGRINVGQIVDLQVPCPSPSEQRQIADHLDARRMEYGELTKRMEKQLKLLQERRGTLLAAAMTGKVGSGRPGG